MGRLKESAADDLFGFTERAVRNTDPDTSHAAAQRAPTARARDRMLVLHEHAKHPAGLTDFELAANLDRQQTSVGKRRGELRDAGLIHDTGNRWPAPSGSAAIVWALTEAGRKTAEETKCPE